MNTVLKGDNQSQQGMKANQTETTSKEEWYLYTEQRIVRERFHTKGKLLLKGYREESPESRKSRET